MVSVLHSIGSWVRSALMAVDPTASVRKLALKFAQLVGTGTRLPPRAMRFNRWEVLLGATRNQKESTAQCYVLSVMMLTKGMQRRVSSVVVAKSPLDSLISPIIVGNRPILACWCAHENHRLGQVHEEVLTEKRCPDGRVGVHSYGVPSQRSAFWVASQTGCMDMGVSARNGIRNCPRSFAGYARSATQLSGDHKISMSEIV